MGVQILIHDMFEVVACDHRGYLLFRCLEGSRSPGHGTSFVLGGARPTGRLGSAPMELAASGDELRAPLQLALVAAGFSREAPWRLAGLVADVDDALVAAVQFGADGDWMAAAWADALVELGRRAGSERAVRRRLDTADDAAATSAVYWAGRLRDGVPAP